MHKGVSYLAVASLVLALSAGCGSEHEMGKVSGTVTIKGKPGNKIQVQFSPMGETKGPNSFAETDDQGRYELAMYDENGKETSGAVVGSHRVTLYDLRLGESATGRGVPVRLRREYSMPGRSPISKTVSAGEQTIDISVP